MSGAVINADRSKRLYPARATGCRQHTQYGDPLLYAKVLNISGIAFSIPDFEGQAILRIFANSTQSEIACYTASVTNGASFKQSKSVGLILGLFALVAVISSLATAMYGERVSEMRSHYAHSMSVLVVFAVYHHIYFTGALSMNWPSVLVAWWSNFAWSAGMIYNSNIQNGLTKFMGKNVGDTLAVGAARVNANSSNVGGGYDVNKIYKRSDPPMLFNRTLPALTKRSLVNQTSGFKWYGGLVRPGLPLPGNYSGFAGTLSEEDIPASNAFLTALIWFAVLLLIIGACIAICKYVLEGLYRWGYMKTSRLDYFREHWPRYVAAAILRACYIAFFMMTFLTVFQFTYKGSPGALAIAGVVFTAFLIGVSGIVAYACYFGIALSHFEFRIIDPGDRTKGKLETAVRSMFHRKKTTDSETAQPDQVTEKSEIKVHDDDIYTVKFGWLSSRLRSSKWWFFSLWAFYEFLRACFYGGASGHPLVQVFCLLVLEIVAFGAMVKLRPYEGQRLNIIMTYLLGFSKVITLALSSAFDITFNIKRIPATAIGIIIIVIQGLLTIALLVCIVLGAISSYFSLTRNRESIKPRSWLQHRERYLAHVQQAARDGPSPRPDPTATARDDEVPSEPYFSVNSVRRMAKIEDEDPDFLNDIAMDPRHGSRTFTPPPPPVSSSDVALASGSGSGTFAAPGYSGGTPPHPPSPRASVAVSIRSTASHSSLPRAAVLPRGSWSTRDWHDAIAAAEHAGGSRAGSRPASAAAFFAEEDAAAARRSGGGGGGGYASPAPHGSESPEGGEGGATPRRKPRPGDRRHESLPAAGLPDGSGGSDAPAGLRGDPRVSV
jgi:hypothetical protein